MYKCLFCEKEYDNYKSLSRHATMAHNIGGDHFYVKFYLKGIWPTCKCGCGEKVSWRYQTGLSGFRDFVAGHQSRVNNNWGHNKKAIEKSAETRRKQFSSGERKVWNDGLTKEDPRVLEYSNRVAERFTPAIRREYSKRMKRLRKEGKIVPLRGSDHSQWNGGTSSISMLVYNDLRFYNEWKFPILKRDGFKCVDCGSNQKLQVHHDSEMLCEIIKKHVGDGIDTSDFKLKDSIADAVVDYHIKNNVSGKTMCKECHGKIHPSLNF